MSDEIQSKRHYRIVDRILFAMGVLTVATIGYAYWDIFLARKAILEGEEMLGKATLELQKQIKEFDHTKKLSEFPTLLVNTGVTKRKWYRTHRDLEYSIDFRKSINVPLSLGHPEKKFRSMLQTAKRGDLTNFMDIQMEGLTSREYLLGKYYLQEKKSQDFSRAVNKVVNKIKNTPSAELNRKIEELFPRHSTLTETTSPLSRMRPLSSSSSSSSEETQPLLRRTSSSDFSTTFHDDQPAGDGLKAYHRRMASKSFEGQGGGGGGLRREVELAPQAPRTYEILNRRAKDIYKSIKERNFKDIKPSEVQEFLTRENWTLEKVDGSHFIYQKGVKVRVPVHARGLAIGTCRAIFEQIGVLER